jgi:vacuolar-type H+-ATPase subunit I/STV1
MATKQCPICGEVVEIVNTGDYPVCPQCGENLDLDLEPGISEPANDRLPIRHNRIGKFTVAEWRMYHAQEERQRKRDREQEVFTMVETHVAAVDLVQAFRELTKQDVNEKRWADERRAEEYAQKIASEQARLQSLRQLRLEASRPKTPLTRQQVIDAQQDNQRKLMEKARTRQRQLNAQRNK